MISRDYITEILLEDILEFHSELEESDIPVEDGVRDMALLESAVNAPFQTFAGQDLFPSIYEKAARLLYGIANNHAFVDGNKRIGVYIMLSFLEMNGIRLQCTDDELVDIGLSVASSRMRYEELLQWVLDHKA